MDTSKLDLGCSFCKIIQGEETSFQLAETELSYAFLATPPVTKGHALVVPKYHAVKMHEVPDKYLEDLMKVAKKIAEDQKLENYNIIQNNGRLAYQSVDHVHFHVINKPDAISGLVVTWPPNKSTQEIQEVRTRLYENRKGKILCTRMEQMIDPSEFS